MTEPIDESLVNVDRAFQTAWIVYINGIECPALSVSVSYGVWQIPECEVTMIPDPILQRLGAEDRVSVQVFYCDYWQRPDEPEFRLMFDGEIVAWNYVNVQRGRAISFTCIDYIQIFTQVFFFFMSNVDDIATGISAEECGVGINSVNTPGFGALYPYSLFAEGLVSVEGGGSGDGQGAPLIKRPIDFVYNVVRGLIQADSPNRSVPAANFFSPWTERTHFHRRFIALPLLERSDTEEGGLFPILRAVRADFAVSAVARLASSVGSSGSIWNMLQQVLMTMMMEINMLPTASAVKINNYPTNTSTGLDTAGPPVRNAEGIVPSQGTEPLFLTNYFVKPQFLFGLPPSCNVFYPSQVVHFAYEENYITQPTRMYFNEESWTSYLNTSASVEPGLRNLMRDALAVAHPEEVHIAARAAIDNPGENNKNILVYPEEFYKGPVVDRRPMPRWFTFLENSASGARDDAEGPPSPTPVTEPNRATPRPAPRSASTPISNSNSNVRIGPRTRARLSAPASAEQISLAREIGIPVDVLRGIEAVESRGNPRATLFMPHIFHRETDRVYEGDPRMPARGGRRSTDRAFNLPAKGGVTRRQIKEAAVKATSWGRYQVHSLHLTRRGTPEEQIAAFDADPEAASREVFIAWWRLPRNQRRAVPAARARDISRLAIAYNGPGTIRRPWRGNVEAALRYIPLDPEYPLQGEHIPEPAVEEDEEGGTATDTTANSTPSVEPPVTDVAPTVSPDAQDQNVYRMYAKYEYYKERYARRTGGLQLVFNPYPVPGFPCAVFDRRSTQVDVFGYIMNVRQTMHSGGWATQLAFSYGRTFREVFDLMNRQFSIENETIAQQRSETRNAVIDGVQSRLAGQGTRVGAIAVAPPEPISEVRDVIQDFTRAEAFYRSLFFRAASPESSALDREQIRTETTRQVEEVVTDPAPGQQPNTPSPGLRASSVTAQSQTVDRDLRNKTAAFIYSDIIEFEDGSGLREGLQLEGIGTSARNRIVDAVQRMRKGEASAEDIAFVQGAVDEPTLVQQPANQDPNPDIAARLNAIELSIRNSQVRSNITGDRVIVPKREALHLFNSYEAAMRQAARPICSLDEYIAFLGEDGIKEGRITPETALLQGDSRTFPAPYYVRIRSYTPGPPANIPSTDITNTEVVTTVDGVAETGNQADLRVANADNRVVSGLPDDFPENRANWTAVLLAYRVNSLSRLPPRT